MSWLARSIANSLDDSADLASSPPDAIPESPRGVKEDLSELKNTLSRQLRGVASFLAPPPIPSDEGPAEVEGGGGEVIEGIRSDFAEIGDSFRSGISRISKSKAVWEFTKMASSLLQLGGEEEEEEEGGLGVSKETVDFARNAAMNPENWLNFPIMDWDDGDDFELSDAQYKHALAIEKHAPGLAALKMELCHGYMSEERFWKIYFVLLLPQLKKEDAARLSTQQLTELRVRVIQELQSHNSGKPKSHQSEGGVLLESGESSHKELLSAPLSSGPLSEMMETSTLGASNTDIDPVAEAQKHPVQAGEIHVIGKPVDRKKQIDADEVKYELPFPNSCSQVVEDKHEDDGKDCLKEDTPDIADIKGTTPINIEDEEIVSFSDLEDGYGDIPDTYDKVVSGSNSSTRHSSEWDKYGGSSDDSTKDINAGGGEGAETNQDVDTEGSNDWFHVDDFDQV